MTIESKYTWTAVEMDKWLKEQAEKLRKMGFQASTSNTSKLLFSKVIVPNNINLCDLVKDKIKIRRKKGLL